jgi:hypothetical protein
MDGERAAPMVLNGALVLAGLSAVVWLTPKVLRRLPRARKEPWTDSASVWWRGWNDD